jgi:ribosomal protein L6P/L9E
MKRVTILKQGFFEKIIFFNSIKKIYLKSLKGFGFLDVLSKKKELQRQIGNNNYSLKIFLTNKSKLNYFINSVDTFFKGVSQGFFFELTVRGIGYKCLYIGDNKLFLNLGYSHYIIYTLPKDVIVFLKKGKIYIYTLSKELLGLVVKELKSMRIPDAYKAKGIVEANKLFNLKEGKKR